MTNNHPPGDDLVERLERVSAKARLLSRTMLNEYGLGVCDDEIATLNGMSREIDDVLSSLEAEKRGLVEALELIEFYSDSEYARETARDAIATLTKAGSVVPETKA
jgi:hypothetical protein